MKKLTKHTFMLLFALSLSVFFISCSSDDDKDGDKGDAQIEGKYTGTYVFVGGPSGGVPATVAVTSKGSGSYQIVFSSSSSYDMPATFTVTPRDTGVDGIWMSGTITIVEFLTKDKGIRVNNISGNIYTFTGER